MDNLPKIIPKSEGDAEPTPFRNRPEAFVIAGLVFASGYLKAFGSTKVAMNGDVIFEHPHVWPFHPSMVDLSYFDVAMFAALLTPMAIAPAFLYVQWRRGFYSLRAVFGLMVVTAAVFSLLSSSSNDVLADSVAENVLAIPLIVGGISLIFVLIHLWIKAVFRPSFSRKRFLDPP